MSRILLFVLAVLLTACSDSGNTTAQSSPTSSAELPNMQKILQSKFLNAQPGDVITIPEGTFDFQRSLSLKVDGVTVRGAGMYKTILSFKHQAVSNLSAC